MTMKSRKDYLNDKLLSIAAWRKRYIKLQSESKSEDKLTKCARMMMKSAEELYRGHQTDEDNGRDWGWWD